MSNPLKKTMVYLGLAEEEFEAEPKAPASAPAPAEPAAPATTQQSSRAQVTPLRRVTPTRGAQTPAMNEILTVHPREYRDAQQIAETFRDGVPVIINLSQMNEAEAKRLIDFASGLSLGLFGKIERVTSKVFLLSPSHIAVSSDSQDAEDSSFFVNS